MLGLTSLGIFHTAISLVAVTAGIVAFVRHKRIAPDTTAGVVYIATTVVVAVTGFGIFQHGGFGRAHILGVLTLAAIGLAAVARRQGRKFRGRGQQVELASYSTTFLFHLIPALTETLTRLPSGAPMFATPDALGLQANSGVIVLMFVVGITIQLRWFREQDRSRLLDGAGLPSQVSRV